MDSNQVNIELNYTQLAKDIKLWSQELGFQQTGISNTNLADAEAHLTDWLKAGFHGEMKYMESHGSKRSHPQELVPGTLTIISVRMDYWPGTARNAEEGLNDNQLAYVSRYALGRDYHKLIRNRLQKLATKIENKTGSFGYRVFIDSAPVLEKPLANKASLGWIGKHTNLINEKSGSWFFLGELYTNLPLPEDSIAENHCGTCTSCIDICPTNAIVEPYRLDARRCISYLTIELRSSIPVEFRPLLGNRIYGCDDCQLACPWNRFSQPTSEQDFLPRHNLDNVKLIELFNWTEDEFLSRTEGSAIRRIGHECWLRNIAVALGNSDTSTEIITALQNKTDYPSALVREHVHWALEQHGL